MLSRSPFHRWLGMRVVEGADSGTVKVEVPWREELMSNPDARVVHGGVLATLVDSAADLAIGARLGYTLPTVDLCVDYHKAAVECGVVAVGRVIRIGRTIASAGAEIYDPAGSLLASGRAVFLMRPWAGRSNHVAAGEER